jgi:hypothetical protein
MQPTLCEATVLIAAGRLYQPARLAVSTMPTPTSQPKYPPHMPSGSKRTPNPARPYPTSHSQLQARTARRRAFIWLVISSVCLSVLTLIHQSFVKMTNYLTLLAI